MYLCGPLVKWPKTPASHAGNMGSNPVRVTIFYFVTNAYLAQSVEHAAVNRRVVGSSPTIGAKQLVLIAARVHPFPYRTRKLSSLALKILGGKLPGKISRCQHLNL